MSDQYNPYKKREDETVNAGGMQAPPPAVGAPPQGSTVTGAGTGPKTPNQGGGVFSNLHKYIDANKNSQMGQGIVQDAQKKADAVQPQMGQAADDVRKQLGAEQSRLNQAGVEQSGNTSSNGMQLPNINAAQQQNTQDSQQQAQYRGLFADIQNDATSVANDAGKAGEFAKIYGGQYQAPNVNTAQFQPNVNQLQDIAKSAQSEQGRYNLLNQTYGRPTYTTGQQRLDQLLLQSNPNQAKTLQTGTQSIAQNQAKALQDLIAEQSGAQDAVRTLAEKRQEEARGLLGTEAIGEGKGSGLLGTLVDSAEDRLATTNKTATDNYNTLKDIFSGRTGAGEENANKAKSLLSSLGYKDNDNFFIPEGTNAENFIGSTAKTTGLGGVIEKPEVEKYLALQKLTGGTGSFLTGNEKLEKFDPNSFFNREQANAVNAAGTEQIKPYQQKVNSLQPAVKLQSDLASGMSPIEAMKKAISTGLDPNVAVSLMSGSKEFQNIGDVSSWSNVTQDPTISSFLNSLTGNGGMRANYSSLNDRLNAQAFLPTYQRQIQEAQNEIGKSVGKGGKISDILSRYANLPTGKY